MSSDISPWIFLKIFQRLKKFILADYRRAEHKLNETLASSYGTRSTKA